MTEPGTDLADDQIPVDPTEPPEETETDVITYQISYYPSDFTLKGYLDKWEAGQLVIPSFQRNYVWDQVQASKLMESFLLGLPVPGVFLYKERNTNKLVVIDGQQRILSAVRFFHGKFDDRLFRLKNVQERWEAKTFTDLSEPDQYQLQDSVLRATVVQQLDPADDSSIYHIFERLNTGGLKLSPMEIRKCVYYGHFYALLEKLNRNSDWRQIVGQAKPERRLRDVEFVLRVLAMTHSWVAYEKPMKTFLNRYMTGNQFKDGPENAPFLIRVEQDFAAAAKRVIESLGEKPFHLRGRINLAVLDSVMSIFFEPAAPAGSEATTRFDALKANSEYLDNVTRNTSDTAVVRKRFEIARSVMLPDSGAA